MKNQALFSSKKIKIKKFKMSSAAIFVWRFKDIMVIRQSKVQLQTLDL